jgi:hypothetical protein
MPHAGICGGGYEQSSVPTPTEIWIRWRWARQILPDVHLSGRDNRKSMWLDKRRQSQDLLGEEP